MAHDTTRAVPQPVRERTAREAALPAPRRPVHETPAARDDAPPVLEPAAPETAGPAPRPEHGPGAAGWIVTAVAAAAAAWVVGWITGVTWAWRAMTPRYLRRSHRRRGRSLAASA